MVSTKNLSRSRTYSITRLSFVRKGSKGNFLTKKNSFRLFNRYQGWSGVYSLCWFSLNSSEMVTVILQQSVTFYKRHLRQIQFLNLPQSPDTGENSDESMSDFRISGQSLINKNRHNSGTSNSIDMKLGPVTKLCKRNKEAGKNLKMTYFQKTVTSVSQKMRIFIS